MLRDATTRAAGPADSTRPIPKLGRGDRAGEAAAQESAWAALEQRWTRAFEEQRHKGTEERLAPWHQRPHGLWSLWEMFGFFAFEFGMFVDLFNIIEGSLKFEAKSEGATSIVPAERVAKIVSTGSSVSRMRELASLLEMQSVVRHFQTIDLAAERGMTYEEFIPLVEQLKVRVIEELQDRWFLFVQPRWAKVYQDPLDGWRDVPALFPSAMGEIQAASRCLAVQEPTAAVFHLMRVLEGGLMALGSDLAVNAATLATKSWGSILNEIQQAIPAKVKAIADPILQKAEAESYHGLAAQFDHFREAWRDRVSHSLRVYNMPEAEGVLVGVRAFMLRLAERGLQEAP
jgi:hypothetical protein